MVAPLNPIPNAPFVLEPGDRLHKIMVGEVTVPFDPPYTSVITFFSIYRMSGKFDVVCINKIFQSNGMVSRTSQSKTGISRKWIKAELMMAKDTFARGIEEATSLEVIWHELDLSDVTNTDEQFKRMQGWPGLKAWRRDKFSFDDIGFLS